MSNVTRKEFVRCAPCGYESASWHEVPIEANRKLEALFAARRCCPLFIHGGTGTGKTCLSVLIYRGRSSALWYRADDLLLSLASGRTSDKVTLDERQGERTISRTATYREALNKVRNVGWLFLDDLGVQSYSGQSSQWLAESRLAMMFDLLEMRKGRPTVITSNYAPQQIGELFDDRIVDRLDEGGILFLDGESRRRESRKAFRVQV